MYYALRPILNFTNATIPLNPMINSILIEITLDRCFKVYMSDIVLS